MPPAPAAPPVTGGRVGTGLVTDPAALGLNAVIDMNHTNKVMDFSAASYHSNIRAVIHKASEGVGWVDPAYVQRRAQAESLGMLWGAYHFGTHTYSGAEQAAAFLEAAQPGPATVIALDLEPNERNPANSMDLGQAEDFVRTIYAALGRLPLLYTHPTWADGKVLGKGPQTLGGSIESHSILASCDLWLADYRTQPQLPRAWAGRGWHFWQYAGDGERGGPFGAYARSVRGIERCDRNLFASDEEGLRRYWTAEAGRRQDRISLATMSLTVS